MLYLTRAIGEIIIIDKNIEIKVMGFEYTPSGNLEVKLGFEAPREVKILRKEIMQSKQIDFFD